MHSIFISLTHFSSSHSNLSGGREITLYSIPPSYGQVSLGILVMTIQSGTGPATVNSLAPAYHGHIWHLKGQSCMAQTGHNFNLSWIAAGRALGYAFASYTFHLTEIVLSHSLQLVVNLMLLILVVVYCINKWAANKQNNAIYAKQMFMGDNKHCFRTFPPYFVLTVVTLQASEGWYSYEHLGFHFSWILKVASICESSIETMLPLWVI